jgi:hypothetical protein
MAKRRLPDTDWLIGYLRRSDDVLARLWQRQGTDLTNPEIRTREAELWAADADDATWKRMRSAWRKAQQRDREKSQQSELLGALELPPAQRADIEANLPKLLLRFAVENQDRFLQFIHDQPAKVSDAVVTSPPEKSPVVTPVNVMSQEYAIPDEEPDAATESRYTPPPSNRDETFTPSPPATERVAESQTVISGSEEKNTEAQTPLHRKQPDGSVVIDQPDGKTYTVQYIDHEPLYVGIFGSGHIAQTVDDGGQGHMLHISKEQYDALAGLGIPIGYANFQDSEEA